MLSHSSLRFKGRESLDCRSTKEILTIFYLPQPSSFLLASIVSDENSAIIAIIVSLSCNMLFSPVFKTLLLFLVCRCMTTVYLAVIFFLFILLEVYWIFLSVSLCFPVNLGNFCCYFLLPFVPPPFSLSTPQVTEYLLTFSSFFPFFSDWIISINLSSRF